MCVLVCACVTPSAPKVYPKELVLNLPRPNRRRVVGRNAGEPTGHPHSLVRNFLTRFKHTSLETLAVVAEGTQPSSDPSGIFSLQPRQVQEASPRLHASSVRCVVSLGRSRKSNSILGFTYCNHTGSSGCPSQRHSQDIRADYVDFEGHWESTPKKPKMRQCQVVICG